MTLILRFLLLILYITVIRSSIYTNVKSNLYDFLKSSKEILYNVPNDQEFKETIFAQTPHPSGRADDEINYDEKIIMQSEKKMRVTNIKQPQFLVKSRSVGYQIEEPEYKYLKHLRDNAKDVEIAQNKAAIVRKSKKLDNKFNNQKRFESPEIDSIGKEFFHIDPVLNEVRRKNKRRNNYDTESDSFTSTEELGNWKDLWKEHWMLKKFEAINESLPQGDMVNMIGARPWGKSCGDPAQHDMPWGTCMLPMECEPEFRIYRGDFFCGRTEFVCCALQLTTYDLYQGFDVSFDDKSLSTDSAEKKVKSKEKNRKRHRREKKRRKKERLRRKRAIKKNIKKIVKEIAKLLNRQYRNGTSQRKKKTRVLKKFVKRLKKQYKADRNSLKELHEEEMLKIDARLQARLNQIRGVNDNFMKNDTFRDIIINGTITKQGAKMLVQAYPELAEMFKTRRVMQNNKSPRKDYLEYDIEYGYLYY